MKGVATKQTAAVILSLSVLGAAGYDRLTLLAPRDAQPYHARVRESAASLPARLGDWTSREVPVPTESVNLLRPNVILSREYANVLTGEQVMVLLVQCRDVRDLMPHYPPVCYPGRGLSLIATTQEDWRIAGRTIPGTEYTFESNTFRQGDVTVVDNFMVLPDGTISRDMKQVKEHASLPDRYFGAAQVQVVFSGGISRVRRKEILNQIVSGFVPLIDAISAGDLQ